MSKLFYDNLISRDDLLTEIDNYAIDPEEKDELITLIDEIINNHILNVILNHLPQEHHSEFIDRLHKAPHDPSHFEYLKTRITVDIELHILQQTQKVKREILADVKKAHSNLRRRV